MTDYAFILIIAAAVTYLLTPAVRRFAFAIGAAPAPRARDVHTMPVPRLGGIAMFGGLIAGLAVAYRLTYTQQAFPSTLTIWGLVAASGLLVVIGVFDDRFGLSPISKLAGQVAAGGILVWSGAYLSWLPLPGSQTLALEPDLSYTLTIFLVVVTINAVNFIDGLDGLAAGVTGVAGLAYLVYSYTLTNSVGIPSQSVPAVASAVLAGVCLGFLPHNFHPARIFMGDTGSMLLGLLLAYGPIYSTASLDQNILTNYSQLHPVNRFPTILPLLLPLAIWIIPYADLLMAVIRRVKAGQSPFAADRKHLHHRMQDLGHSHRQSVLLFYLWAALFAGGLVGLSQLHISLVWLALTTTVMVGALLLATVPRLRPWNGTASGEGTASDEGTVSGDRQGVEGGGVATTRSGQSGQSRAGEVAPWGPAPEPTSVPADFAAPPGSAPGERWYPRTSR
ncbi:MAG: undecaprenyl/decaprenyl-phosphate alpha-N-acetylglucosaminyl 1-phosphate transferase [Nocardiopsaceae bacterium]|nr:undecaprenyl/decaprenyl-phosphate alpha-N-acetylglucosaminyl 1-phosphate transferase [Nocardiopsaceae bacterium]